MILTDETLIAYVDRELDAESVAAIETAAARDPQLAERIERHRALRNTVHAAYAPVLDEPMPKRLLDLASGVPPAPRLQPRRWAWLEWGAVSASLAIGVLVGATLLRESAGDFAERQGRLIATGKLEAALSRQLASNQPANVPIRIGLSFVSRDGKYCRTFLSEKNARAGLACNDAGRWQLEVIARAQSQPGEYRVAGAPLPAAVLRAVEERMQGNTLDAAAERAASERGWRR